MLVFRTDKFSVTIIFVKYMLDIGIRPLDEEAHVEAVVAGCPLISAHIPNQPSSKDSKCQFLRMVVRAGQFLVLSGHFGIRDHVWHPEESSPFLRNALLFIMYT